MPKTEVAKLDAKLDWVRDRMNKTVDIALERVIAHNENPQYYQLPNDPKSLERAFHKLFKTLPRKNQKDLIERVNKTLKATRTERAKVYGDLADVDFRSKTPIVDQIKTKPVPEHLKITEADVPEMRRRLKLPTAVKSQKPIPAQAAEAIEVGFDVVSLTCKRPTDVRKDEMSMAGFAVDNVGGELSVAPFFVGDFKKGESLALGGQSRLFNFKLTLGEFPKAFVASIILLEKDLLRDSELINALIFACLATISALLAIGAAVFLIGGLSSLPVVGAIGLIATGLSFVQLVLKVFRDDTSSVTDLLVLDAPVAPGTIIDRDPLSITIGQYKGEYEATVRWVTA